MKSSLFVEYQDIQIDEKVLIKKAKDVWTAEGNKLKDIKTLNLYVKPEDNAVYYVINDTFTGCVEMN